MAISNATRLSDFGSGIGTQGAILQVDNVTQRVGIGTTNPQFTLDVKGTLNATTLGLTNINVSGIASIGAGVTVYGAGIVSATSYRGDGSSLTGFAATDNINSNNIKVSGITTLGTTSTIVGSAVTFDASGGTIVGVLTATCFEGDGSSLTGVAATDNINTNNIAISGIATVGTSITMRDGAINVTGVVTATSFEGDGSALSGVSGFGSAFDNTSVTLGNLIFETPRSFYQTGVTSAYINAEDSSGNMAFTRLNDIRLGVGATMHIGAGTTLIMNVLNLF